MKKILVASMAFDAERGGGSVRMAYDLATHYARMGNQVIVICEDQFNKGIEYNIEDGIIVLRYRLSKPRYYGILRHKQHFRAVKKVLSKYLIDPPDIVHGHSLFQYFAVLDVFKDKSTCCYTIHSPAIEELKITWGGQGISGKIKLLFGLRIIRNIEYNLLIKSSILSALSQYTISLISKHYGKEIENKIQIIPGWTDLEKFRPIHQEKIEEVRQKLGWPLRIPVFFTLRRLEIRMGLDNLIKAVSIVKKEGYDLKVIIGGCGSLRMRLEKYRDRLGLKNAVMFMGFIPGDDLPLAYGACDASLIPTAKLECFGIIALEALACGRTTLVTPVGALPEVMRNIEPRWIARDSNPKGIADLIIAFIKKDLPVHSPHELHRLIEQEYSCEKAMNSYERFI